MAESLKAIVIDEPWIDLILDGRKTWEMRKRGWSHRGPVGLIRKGSGTVAGVARLVDVKPPLVSIEEFAAAEPWHAIGPDRREEAFGLGWTVPWVLEDVIRLASPVRYGHPKGAVVSVNLSEEETARVADEMRRTLAGT